MQTQGTCADMLHFVACLQAYMTKVEMSKKDFFQYSYQLHEVTPDIEIT